MEDIMSAKSKNITFSLPEEYILKLRKYSENKSIASMNAGVKMALEKLFLQIEKEKLYNTMQAASEDKMFMNDIEETMSAYKVADSEISGGKDEW